MEQSLLNSTKKVEPVDVDSYLNEALIEEQLLMPLDEIKLKTHNELEHLNL